MTLQTRKLTGKPPWPITALAGPEKVGKTWAAVEACMSPLVSGGLWFPLGEDDPDEYALIPGFDHDRFDLVEHDGSYRGLLAALDDAVAEEKAAGPKDKPTVWVLDSGTRLWDLLSVMAQREMYERLRKKAEREKRPVPDIEQKPSVDLWNVAADRWGYIFSALRAHRGPVVITVRMELTTVMDAGGNPTKDKTQKLLAQKRLPFDVGSIVEMMAVGETYLTGVRSVKLAAIEPRVKFTNFSMDLLWRRLGLEEPAGERNHSDIDPDDKPAAEAEVARSELRELAEANGWELGAVAAEWAAQADGQPLKDSANAAAIRRFAAELIEQWKPKEKAA